MLKKIFKNLILVLLASLSLTTLFLGPLKTVNADTTPESTILLRFIAVYNYDILKAVNSLPNYLLILASNAVSWLTPDTSTQFYNFQSGFSKLNTTITTNVTTQTALQQPLLTDFYKDPSLTKIPGISVDATSADWANDFTFQTLLGQPFYTKDPRPQTNPPPDPAYNYIRNASGMNLVHYVPDLSWTGGANAASFDAFYKYKGYYSTIRAAETFNAYILSQWYADYRNGLALTPAQQTLIDQANNSDWFVQIASEELGKVLRQILMFDSQTYVMLNQLVQIQRQLLLAQVMTNSLIIANGSTSEDLLYRKALNIIK